MSDALTEQRPLLGYLQCPCPGIRWNQRTHPWTRRPSVDTIHLQVLRRDDFPATLAHFRALGYVAYCLDEQSCVATLVLPKLDASGLEEVPVRIEPVIQELRACVQALRARPETAISTRVLRAVLCLDQMPADCTERILQSATPLHEAVEFFASTTTPSDSSVLAHLAEALSADVCCADGDTRSAA